MHTLREAVLLGCALAIGVALACRANAETPKPAPGTKPDAAKPDPKKRAGPKDKGAAGVFRIGPSKLPPLRMTGLGDRPLAPMAGPPVRVRPTASLTMSGLGDRAPERPSAPISVRAVPGLAMTGILAPQTVRARDALTMTGLGDRVLAAPTAPPIAVRAAEALTMTGLGERTTAPPESAPILRVTPPDTLRMTGIHGP